MTNPLVSVIIPTYNSSRTILSCLNSISTQNYVEVEIIVVDNLSSDETPNIVKSNGATLVSSSCDRAQARNIGASRSKGKYLLNIDSDMELSPELINECVGLCEDGALDALIVTETSFGDGYFAKCRSLEKKMLIYQTGYEYLRFIRKSAFDILGGYDTDLEAGEDRDFHERTILGGFKVGRTNSLIRHNEGHPTLSSIIMKDIKYGRTIDKYIQKNNKPTFSEKRLPSVYLDNIDILLKNVFLIPGLITIHILGYIFITKHLVKLHS